MSNSDDRHAIPSTATDLELLRAFEPVVCFTAGEQFFPMDIERYVRSCSLWLYHPDDHDEQVVPEGELTLETLLEPRTAPFGAVFYLRCVRPLGIENSARALADYARLRRRQAYTFRTGLGRLARGGLVPRLIDAVFSATLLLRRRVPKATAAVAVLEYTGLQEQKERFVYHGRTAAPPDAKREGAQELRSFVWYIRACPVLHRGHWGGLIPVRRRNPRLVRTGGRGRDGLLDKTKRQAERFMPFQAADVYLRRAAANSSKAAGFSEPPVARAWPRP